MRSIPVWDLIVRATHWAVALLVIGDLTVLSPHWAVHRWAGYAALALIALRLLWGLVGTRHARFTAFPPSLEAAKAHLGSLVRGRRETHLSHNPLGALMAYNLWISLLATGLTGWLSTTSALHGVELVAGMHELLANWVLISVLLHVAGVGFETWYSKVNLVRAMITGRKEIPGPRE